MELFPTEKRHQTTLDFHQIAEVHSQDFTGFTLQMV